MYGIVAADYTGGIGKNRELPWKIKEDMIRFRKITSECPFDNKKNCVIMGRKTWEDIKYPLVNRINIVLSTTLSDNDFRSGNDVDSFTYSGKPDFIAKNKQEIFDWLDANNNKIYKTFIIGGKEIYNLFFEEIQTFELTIVKNDYECDTKIDLQKIYNNFKLVSVSPENNHVNLVLKRLR